MAENYELKVTRNYADAEGYVLIRHWNSQVRI